MAVIVRGTYSPMSQSTYSPTSGTYSLMPQSTYSPTSGTYSPTSQSTYSPTSGYFPTSQYIVPTSIETRTALEDHHKYEGGVKQQSAKRGNANDANGANGAKWVTRLSPGDPTRFTMAKKLQDANGSGGEVYLLWDREKGMHVACKRFPKSCLDVSTSADCPRTALSCAKFLASAGFPYGCSLYGVHETKSHVNVLTEYATDGDWFTWASEVGTPPGPSREALVRPLAVQLLDGVRMLHDLSIVHGDISLENVLLSKNGVGSQLQVHIIDFGMSSTEQHCTNRKTGKPSYRAPEMHTCAGRYDGFLADSFSVGVSLYCALATDYPWLSTEPGKCQRFDFMRKHGFREFAKQQTLRCSTERVAEIVSEPVLQLLDGLLTLDPEERLTLGEKVWQSGARTRRSVWDEEWLGQAAIGRKANLWDEPSPLWGA